MTKMKYHAPALPVIECNRHEWLIVESDDVFDSLWDFSAIEQWELFLNFVL